MIVLVTGAYGGIGHSVCLAYLSQATTLIITGRDQIKLDALQAELKHASDINIIAITADVSDESQVTALFKEIAAQHKKLDILVHCAGILTQKPLMLTRLSDIQQVLNSNLLSSILFCQQASKLMLRNKFGVITLISSIIASQGSVGQSVYGASKAGIEGLVKSLAKEFGAMGIRINALAPGFINTELVASYDEQEKAILAQKTCLKRLGEVQDIAPVIRFLSSEGARYITGQVIAVDGGLAL